MLTKGLLFSVSLLCITAVFGQTTNAFRVNYDQALFDLPGRSTEALTPSNYVFAGTNMNFLPIYGTITQVDDIGALVWSKRYYDGSIGFQLSDIKRDPVLNEYYLCGGSESNAGVFMRVDATGNVVVSTKFEISEADGAYLKRIIKTSDGGYVAVGYVTGHDPDGGGPETYFAPINYTDANGDPQTDIISSPLIVKFDANGNHQWHHVFRYYTAASRLPGERIYNDASLNDIVEVGDGYMAVGQYDVNQHRSATNSDGDDATPNDAVIIKTTTAGTITYHRQVDNPSTSTGQSSKYLSCISKTSVGDPIAAGSTDGGYELIMKYQALGGFGLTFSRRFRYSTSFFGSVTDPVEVSQIYEVNGSTDLVTMGMYLRVGLPFVISNSLHRVNAAATANTWAKYYDFGFATILPQGDLTSDGGYIMNSTVMGGIDFDYHLIKTDPAGETPIAGCQAVSFSPAASAGPTTIGTPHANNFSGTVLPNGLAVLAQNVSPTASVQCSFTSCTTPTINTQPTDETICSTGSGNLTVNATAGPYQWQYNNGGSWENVTNGSPSGFTYSGGTTDNLTITSTGAAQGTYEFQVIAGDPTCEAISNTVTVTVPGATQLAPASPTCSGVALNFEAFPASGATYDWDVTVPPGTSATPTTGSGQTFSYTPTNTTGSSQNFTLDVDITVNGVTCPVQFINTVNPQPTAPIVGTITQPDCSTPTGSVDLSGLPASGTWTVTASPGGATETNTGTTGTISGLAANTSYTFTVENSFGCTSVASTGATIDPQPATPSAPIIGTITQPDCTTPTGSVDLSGLPGSGTWTITISPGGTTINGTGTTTTITGLAPSDTYTFTVTDDLGCTSSASTNAVIDPVPSAPAAPVVGTITQPDCATATGSVDLSGLPGSGTWTITETPGGATINGSGTTTTITGLTQSTTYTYTVTNDLGCTSSVSVDIIINAQPETPTTPIVGTVTQPDCATATGSVDLSGLPGTGTWTVTASPGGATETNTGTTGTISGLAANTTYTFTVENSDGCTSTATISVDIDPQPTTPSAPIIGTVTQPDCTNPTGSVDLSGLPGSGTWTVTVSPGGTTINGTGTTTSVTGLAPNDTYTFTVTNDEGCTSVSSTSVDIDPVPGAPAPPIVGTITQPDCATATGSVDLSGLPGTGTWTITETPGGATINGTGTTTTITGLSESTTYTYTVTNDLGCTSSVSVDVIINAQPETPSTPIVGNVTQPDCSTATGSVDLSGLPGTGTWTVTASPGGATETNTGTTGTISGLAANTTYTFTVENSDGCISTATITVDIDPQPTTPSAPIAGTVTQPDCTNPTGSVDLSGLPGSGSWTVTTTPGGATTNGSGTTTTITGLTQGNTYTFTVTNDEGCTSTSSITVDIDPVVGAPVVTLDAQTNVTCNGDTDGELIVSASGGQAPYNYSWTPNVGSTSTVSGLGAGSYTVIVTDDLGCFGTDTYTITEPDVMLIDETISNVFCEASLGSISTNVAGGTGPYSYDWTPNGEITPDLTDLSSGSYGLEVTDANGCTVSDNFTVITVGSLSIDVDPEYSIIEEGESVQLNATGAENYTWTPSTGLSCDDCSDPIASPTETTTYYVSATDSSGCTGGDTALVEIRIRCGDFFVPNIFSPNADMNNDYLCVYGSCVTKLIYSVYDRWGELVFTTESTVNLETENYQEVCWDGTFRGKPLNSGVYAYKIYVELFDGEIIEESGNITLVR